MSSSRGGHGVGSYGHGVGGNWGGNGLTQQQQQRNMNNHMNHMNARVVRQRVARPFIDVSGVPDLLDAIELARSQLKTGITFAMGSTLCDEQGNILEPLSSMSKTASEKKSTAPPKKNTPHDIYSVITEQSNKATAEKIAALKKSRQEHQNQQQKKKKKLQPNNKIPIDVDAISNGVVNNTVVSPIKVKIPSSKPPASINNPAYPRPPSPPRMKSAGAAKTNTNNMNINRNANMNEPIDITSVPIPKRKQAPVRSNWNSAAKGGPSILTKRPRTEIPPEHESSAKRPVPPQRVQTRPAPPSMASIASIAANTKPAPAVPRKKTAAEVAAAEGRSTSNVASSSKISALRSKEARSKSIDTSNYAHIRKSVQTKEQVSKTQSARNMSIAMTMSKAPKVMPSLTPLNSRSSAISNKVANTASRTASASSPFPTADTRQRRGLLPLVPSLQRNNSYGSSNSNSNSNSNSYSAGEVLVPPGMKAIGTVKPNGYVCLPNGTLRPRVTFDNKPKVPLKLRQTSVEKLFDAWKDIQKMPVMEALVKALRVEQTMYAQAAGKIDYRAAAITHLSNAKRNTK